MNGSTPGLPVHHQLPESTQTHVLWVGELSQKALLDLLQYYFCFMFWFFVLESCGVPAPQPGIDAPPPPVLEGES